MTDRDHAAITRRAQELASSGDYEGFNAMTTKLAEELGALAVDILRRDSELRRSLNEMCQTATDRKRSRG